MRRLLLLSRVAFIGNICFLITFCLELGKWIHNEDLRALILNIGFILGFILNPITILCYLMFLIFSRSKLKIIPAWLITANILFLVIQIIFIFYINDRNYTAR